MLNKLNFLILKRIVPLLYLIILSFLSSCKMMELPMKEHVHKEDITTIGQLAYNVNPELGYRIYIEESGKLVPYLVLTDDYNGSGMTLLLREYVLPESRRYHDIFERRNAAYYNGSEIDLWLSYEFIKTIKGVYIQYTTINISAEEALGRCGEETENIIRKVFFLSFGELGGGESSVIPASGEPLDYFTDEPTNRIAYCENELDTPCGWWTRSADTWNFNAPVGVGGKGQMGGSGAQYKLSVRPAFCLNSETEIVLYKSSKLGEVFIIKKRDNTPPSLMASSTD